MALNSADEGGDAAHAFSIHWVYEAALPWQKFRCSDS